MLINKHWVIALALMCLGFSAAWAWSASANVKTVRQDLPYLSWFDREATPLTSVPWQYQLPMRAVGAQQLAPAVTGDGAIGDRSGFSLLWVGDQILAGAIGDNTVNGSRDGVNSGTVAVWDLVDGAWQRGANLPTPTDGRGAYFGGALASDGDLLAVGAPQTTVNEIAAAGRVHLYRRVGGHWQFEASLQSINPFYIARFGSAVAVQGDQVLVGAPGEWSNDIPDTGRVFVFEKIAGNWQFISTIESSSSTPGAGFGSAVALNGNELYIGAPNASVVVEGDARGHVARFVGGIGMWTADGVINQAQISANSQFGSALHLSSDLLWIAAARDGSAGVSESGSAWVYQRGVSTPQFVQTLRPNDAQVSDLFGYAMVQDADSVIIGAPGFLSSEGAAYVYTRSAGIWNQQAKLDRVNGNFSDFNGGAVAIKNNQAVMAGFLTDVPPNRATGALQVFNRSGTDWSWQRQLDRGDGAAFDRFGFSVAADDHTILVGAYLDDTAAGSDDAGSVSVFEKNSGAWQRTQILTNSDAEAEDRFGISVAVEGDTAAVGAYFRVQNGLFNVGAVYIFNRVGGVWQQVQKLLASDIAANDYFGYALALRGNQILIGAPGKDGPNANVGAAYLFARVNGVWSQQQKLQQSNWPAEGFAGISVALNDQFAVIGAPESDDGEEFFEGMVHVFRPQSGSWNFVQTLNPDQANENDLFGGAVALSAWQLIIGAPGTGDDPLQSSGVAYTYEHNGSQWQNVLSLSPPIAQAGASFGISVALRDGAAFVGESGRNIAGLLDQGQVNQFAKIDGAWSFKQMLDKPSAEPYAYFGRSLALNTGDLIVGAPEVDRDNPQEGAAFVFNDGISLFRDSFE